MIGSRSRSVINNFGSGTLSFENKLPSAGYSSLNFFSRSYSHDFDENGLLYWMGTNGKTAGDWVNPAQYGLVVVTSSEGRNLPYGRLEDILSRDTGDYIIRSIGSTVFWIRNE